MSGSICKKLFTFFPLSVVIFSAAIVAPLPSFASTNDSDDDGFTDEEEIFIGTDPNDSDTDDDGIMDAGEAIVGTDPTVYDTITDDEYDSDYTLDNDEDGLSNGYELTDGVLGDVQVGNFTGEGGNPNNADTDEDGLGDLFEATYAGECVDITIDNSDHDDIIDPDDDCDGDGLTNDQEETTGTSPLAEDTDSDGFTDPDEIAAGSAPNDANSTPDNINIVDHGAVLSVEGISQGQILLTYADATSVTIDAFNGSGIPQIQLTSDAERIVALKKSGTKLKVYDITGNQLASMPIRNNAQSRAKLKVWNFYSDDNDEIIVVTKRKATLRTTVITLTTDSELLDKNTKVYKEFSRNSYKVKKRKHKIKIKHKSKTVVEYNLNNNGELGLLY